MNRTFKSPAKQSYTLEGLFEGRPAALELYHTVRRFIESIGPVEIRVTKTQVSFGVQTKFAWVWLPQLWTKKRPESSVTLTFSSDHRIHDRRIAGAVEPRPGRWTHHVVIKKAADLDDQVKGCLREAYELAKIAKRRRPPKG